MPSSGNRKLSRNQPAATDLQRGSFMDMNRQEAGSGPLTSRGAFGPSFRERRQESRTTLTQVFRVNLGPENGGVVTDVGTSGMGLRADLPMDAARDISFSIVVGGSSLRGWGEIVWMDKARMSCGVRFTSLTAPLRLQINKWIDHVEPSLPDDAESTLNAAPAPAVAEAAQPDAAETAGPAPPARETFLMDDWARQDRELSAIRSRAFLRGLATGLFVAAAAVGVLFYVGLARLDHPLTLSNVHVLSASSPSSVPSGSAPSTNSGTASTHLPAASALPAPAPPELATDSSPRPESPSAAALNVAGNNPPPSAPESASSPDPVATTGESSLDEADADLRTGRGREAAALLWKAVSTGNTTAETKLAELYLSGDGVAKSCTQGRVLLRAAAKDGNADAQHRLSSLGRSGCR
jgi:hypothetical protein